MCARLIIRWHCCLLRLFNNQMKIFFGYRYRSLWLAGRCRSRLEPHRSIPDLLWIRLLVSDVGNRLPGSFRRRNFLVGCWKALGLRIFFERCGLLLNSTISLLDSHLHSVLAVIAVFCVFVLWLVHKIETRFRPRYFKHYFRLLYFLLGSLLEKGEVVLILIALMLLKVLLGRWGQHHGLLFLGRVR
jgi:hypothetical protein